MPDARLLIALLYVAAFALPSIAAVRTYRNARRSILDAERRAEDYEAIYKEWTDGGGRAAQLPELQERFDKTGFPVVTAGSLPTVPVRLTAITVRHVLDGGTSNAWLAGIGLVAGLVASVWSLCV